VGADSSNFVDPRGQGKEARPDSVDIEGATQYVINGYVICECRVLEDPGESRFPVDDRRGAVQHDDEHAEVKRHPGTREDAPSKKQTRREDKHAETSKKDNHGSAGNTESGTGLGWIRRTPTIQRMIEIGRSASEAAKREPCPTARPILVWRLPGTAS